MSRVAAPLRKRLTLALIVAVAMLCAAPMSAQAEKLDRRDARGDVIRGDRNTGASVATPGHADADIVRSVFRHKRHRVRVRLNFAELIRPVTGALQVRIEIRTNERTFRQVFVSYLDDGPQAPPFFDIFVIGPNEEEFDCRIFRSFDFSKNVVIIGMRRACLSHPRWIRVGVDLVSVPGGENAPFAFADEALRRGLSATDTPRLSPRLHRAPPRR